MQENEARDTIRFMKKSYGSSKLYKKIYYLTKEKIYGNNICEVY